MNNPKTEPPTEPPTKVGNIMTFPQKTRYAPDTVASLQAPAQFFDVSDGLAVLRQEAFERVKAQGLPTPKLERWKYTPLARAVKNIEIVPELGGDHIKGPMQYVGQDHNEDDIHALLSAPAMGAEKYKDMALWDLNTAYMTAPMVISIPEGESVDEPFVIDYQSLKSSFSCKRVIFIVKKNASATLIETYKGAPSQWYNHAIQIVVEDGARFDHICITDNDKDAVFTRNVHVEQGEKSFYNVFYFNTGAKLSRMQIQADVNGSHARCDLSIVNMLNGGRHSDSTVEVCHNAPDGQSNQLVRTVLDDHAQGIFQGKVYVDRVAQRTDGYQLANSLVLAEGAEMDTKPELEIYADDVKCSHGSTIGQIDEEPLFYLRSRGLSEEQARTMLIEAFITEAVDTVENEDVRTQILETVQNWLKSKAEA